MKATKQNKKVKISTIISAILTIVFVALGVLYLSARQSTINTPYSNPDYIQYMQTDAKNEIDENKYIDTVVEYNTQVVAETNYVTNALFFSIVCFGFAGVFLVLTIRSFEQ